MRRTAVAFVVTLALAGCGSTGGPTASPGSAAASVSASPIDAPSPSLAASPTAAQCPTGTPMSVATYLGADPSCFGSQDVTLTGWEDIGSGIDAGESDVSLDPAWLGSPAASVLVDQLPETCHLETCDPFLFVHVDPASRLQFELDGVYVVITGHRDDPAAQTCVATPYGEPSTAPTPEPAAPMCAGAFVLTSVREAEAPVAVRPACPTGSPLTLMAIERADPACFHGRDVSIVAWTDAQGPFGLEPPTIAPAWLAYGLLGSGYVLWSGPDHAGCENAEECVEMIPAIVPGSGLTIGKTHRWVLVTGHLDDPASATCQWVYPATWDEGHYDDALARQQCRGRFVLTAIRTTTAPTS